MLAACASAPTPIPPRSPQVIRSADVPTAQAELPELPAAAPTRLQGKSRWTAVPWSDLPGFADDALHEAWNAWLKSCERPGATFAPLCKEVRQLSMASIDEQRAWLQARLQPYRVTSHEGSGDGLLTAYYEPMLEASRLRTSRFAVPIYQLPAGFAQRKPWYTRQEMDTLPAAQAALRGREIAYLSDPIDVLALHIQGSGRLRVTEPTGEQKIIRVAFAGTNDQPYQSVGRWLLDQGLVRDATWPGIKAWLAQNPQRTQELLWRNPRYVFFKEEALSSFDAGFGPRGAQGVPLTPGRSIAVDPQSLPYGTPVWLSSSGPQTRLQKLVLAQDTGSAIVGAVRADYFVGWGQEAGELAGRMKQPLQLWALWPR
jgi:membrane-bound lytic murein transglycosylase A